jgi:7-cyano-7-deazaguanine synthase
VTDTVVLLSGGKDSATILWWARSRYADVTAVSLNYPERPVAERSAAAELARRAGADLVEAQLPFLVSARRIASEGTGRFETETAYIPMRNLVFFAAAAYVAESTGARSLVGGQLASDGVAYSDATPEFFAALGRTLDIAMAHSYVSERSTLSIELPLIGLSDQEVISFGRSLGVPYDVTWSCLENNAEPCAECVSCRDRRRAFAAAERQGPASAERAGDQAQKEQG